MSQINSLVSEKEEELTFAEGVAALITLIGFIAAVGCFIAAWVGVSISGGPEGPSSTALALRMSGIVGVPISIGMAIIGLIFVVGLGGDDQSSSHRGHRSPRQEEKSTIIDWVTGCSLIIGLILIFGGFGAAGLGTFISSGTEGPSSTALALRMSGVVGVPIGIVLIIVAIICSVASSPPSSYRAHRY